MARKPDSCQRCQHTMTGNRLRSTLRVIFKAFLFVAVVVFLILISARGKKLLSVAASKVSSSKTPSPTRFKSALPLVSTASPALLHRDPHCWWLPFLWHSNSQQPGDCSDCFSFVTVFCLFSQCWEACTLKMFHKCLLNGWFKNIWEYETSTTWLREFIPSDASVKFEANSSSESQKRSEQ